MLRILLIVCLHGILVNCVNAQLRTKKTISDHAILQRDIEIPVAGWGNVGQDVELSLNDETYRSTTDSDGRWTINIPPMEAGGPYTITIKVASQRLQYSDIYFGDVWLCSGQSNMEWILANTDNAEEEIASATDAMVRQFKVQHMNSEIPQSEIPEGEWTVLSPESASNFTAVGYYFAKSIRESNEVPIGLLNSSWGGSRIEPWMSKEVLDNEHPAYSYASYTQKNKVDSKEIARKLKERYPGIDDKDAGMKDDQLWVDNQEGAKWESIDPREFWEDQGFDDVDGVAYYRTYFEATEAIELHLGAIDDNDHTWVNGQLVGKTAGYKKDRKYEVPASILRKGKNELLIRIQDTGGGGGMYSSDFETRIGEKALDEFKWEIRLGSIFVNSLSNKIPNLIYNSMIHPILDFPIKGVIWYQGESNAGSLQEAYDYRFLLASLIKQWRDEWNQEELPFYYVQLANFRQPMSEPGTDGWALIRESMTEVLEVPMTGQAVIIDIGDADDIHPRNKKDVGYRLALPAREQVYGEDVVPGSPRYASHTIVGNHVVIEFQQVGDGLIIKDRYGYLRGFSIIDEDGSHEWAQAKLENGKVIFWSDKVVNPVSVRYAWEINPGDANLFTKDGLPVTPFRTDQPK